MVRIRSMRSDSMLVVSPGWKGFFWSFVQTRLHLLVIVDNLDGG